MRVRRPRPAVLIPTASMADIAFLLIIFFMVTTVYDVDRTRVRLPASETQEELEQQAAIVVVSPDPARPGAERYHFSSGDEMSREVEAEELPGLVDAALDRFAAARRSHLFVVKAEGNLPYRVVDGVLQMLRDRGASNIFLLTARKAR